MKPFSIKAVLLVVLSTIFIFSTPLTVFLTTYSDLSIIKENTAFSYTPETPSPRVQLNFYADVGNIEINYNPGLTDEYVHADIEIEMAGLEFKDKTYLHFFNLSWIELNSSLAFYLRIKSDMIDEFSNLLRADIKLTVSLKADIIFDINTTLIQGDIKFQAEYGIHTGNININVSKGNIFYNLYYCIVEGNISGVVSTGIIEFRTFNEKYSQNTNWDLTVETGDISLYIYQYNSPEANITGTVKVNDGDVFFLYEDDSADVGARFDILFDFFVPNCLSSPKNIENCSFIVGFDYTVPDNTPEYDNYIITSWDLIRNEINYYYNLSFDIIQKPVITNCYAKMELESIPIL